MSGAFRENRGVSESKVKRGLFLGKEKRMSPFFQAKLTVGTSDSAYEREADTVAEKVMSVGDTINVPQISPLHIQRKCAECEEEEHVQRKNQYQTFGAAEAPSVVSDALNTPANALDGSTKSFMESRFGYDFSAVKIHTGATAAQSAQSINALAYTSGNSIVFNEGQYSPDTGAGKKLLAHELTHVVQQSSEVVRRYGHDNFCDQSTRLEPFIWPGHARALSMLQNVLAALGGGKDPRITTWVPIFFGKGALSNLSDIVKGYQGINTAIQSHYMYHCNDASNKNSSAKKCHGQRAETDLDMCLVNCDHDITLCFDVITSAWSVDDVASLLIHENYHRAFGKSTHPYGLKDTKAGPPDCGEFALNPPSGLLLDNPDSYGCLARLF